MKILKYILITVVLVNLCLMATADARPHRHHRDRPFVHIGIGYYYPHHHWLGFRYPPPFYYGGYPYYGRYPYWWDDYYPDVIVERPTVYVRETTTPVYRVPAAPDEETLRLFASIRNKKAELLKQLQSSDKAEKIKAIVELAGLTYDDQVREKLKDILLKDPDPDLRKEAATAFGKSKNTGLISILEEARVNDDNKEVRQAADQAIKNIKGN